MEPVATVWVAAEDMPKVIRGESYQALALYHRDSPVPILVPISSCTDCGERQMDSGSIMELNIAPTASASSPLDGVTLSESLDRLRAIDRTLKGLSAASDEFRPFVDALRAGASVTSLSERLADLGASGRRLPDALNK